MHAGAVEGQPAFATEGVVDGPEEGGARGENRDDQLGQAQEHAGAGASGRGTIRNSFGNSKGDPDRGMGAAEKEI